MLDLIEFPWSPYSIVQRRILGYAGARFRSIKVHAGERSLVWKLTRERYYGVPIIKDGREVVFETGHDSQVIAKYLDFKFGLGLFPANLEGVQSIVWRFIENDVEEMTFKLNDIYWKEFVPRTDQLRYLRHKERKFGVGCLEKWRQEKKSLLEELARRLTPLDQMLLGGHFLLGDRPRFLDFDLYGMLGNFLYSGHYRLPAAHARLRAWHRRMETIKFANSKSEKLYS